MVAIRQTSESPDSCFEEGVHAKAEESQRHSPNQYRSVWMVYERLQGFIDALGLRRVATRCCRDEIGPNQCEQKSPSQVAQ